MTELKEPTLVLLRVYLIGKALYFKKSIAAGLFSAVLMITPSAFPGPREAGPDSGVPGRCEAKPLF